MTTEDIRRLEQAIERGMRDLRTEIRAEIDGLRKEVRQASNFQIGFQAISKGLTYVCLIAAAIAGIYSAVK